MEKSERERLNGGEEEKKIVERHVRREGEGEGACGMGVSTG